MNKFEKNLYGTNYVLVGKDCYISYNESPGGGISSWESDEGSSETALVNKKGKEVFKILNGDFRKEYLKVIGKGYSACLKVYTKYKKEHDSSWTGK